MAPKEAPEIKIRELRPVQEAGTLNEIADGFLSGVIEMVPKAKQIRPLQEILTNLDRKHLGKPSFHEGKGVGYTTMAIAYIVPIYHLGKYLIN